MSFYQTNGFVSTKEKKMKLAEVLISLGITPDLKGFEYVVSAVEVYRTYKGVINCYEEVAKKYNVDWHNVERAIRYCITLIPNKKYKEFFGTDKRSNSVFIAMLKLKMEGYEYDR